MNYYNCSAHEKLRQTHTELIQVHRQSGAVLTILIIKDYRDHLQTGPRKVRVERQPPNYLHRLSLKSLIIVVTRPLEVIRTIISEKMLLLCITRVKTLSHRACSLNHWLLMLKCSSLALKWSYRIRANDIFLPLLTLTPQGNRTASPTGRSWGGGVARQAGFGSREKSGSKGKEEEEKTVSGRSNLERKKWGTTCPNAKTDEEWEGKQKQRGRSWAQLHDHKQYFCHWRSHYHTVETQQPASHAIIAQQSPSKRPELKARAQPSEDLIHNTPIC